MARCTSKFHFRKCQHTSLCNGGTTTKPSSSSSSSPATNVTQTTQVDLAQTGAYVIPAVNHTAQTSICLLKTAITPVHSGTAKTTANILFDEGAQHSFISEQLAKTLQISPTTTEQVALSSFVTTSHSHQQLGVTTILIESSTDDQIPVKALILPSIAFPIQNSFCDPLNNVPHLQGLKLAHPANALKFRC